MNIQKKALHALFVAMLSVAFSCSDEDINADSYSLTAEIEKIETSYFEGAKKYEGKTDDAKIETVLPPEELNLLIEGIVGESEEYVKGKRPYHATARTDFNGYDVGVVPLSGACPVGYEQLEIFMDCEDKNPATSLSKLPGTSANQWGVVVDGSRNIRFKFCRVDGRLFKPFAQQDGSDQSYALLRLGNLAPAVPAGAYQYSVIRNFDNEDRRNKNSSIGDIAPNVVNSNTTLRFSVRVGTSAMADPSGAWITGFPASSAVFTDGGTYGVFTSPYVSTSGWSSTGREYRIFTDDEDSSNGNWAYLDNLPYANEFPWLTCNSNTYMTLIYPL